jgi:hypothetical protein
VKISKQMVRGVGIALILSLTGGCWLILQTVAWTKMMVDYSRSASLKTAVVQTFDGKHPCEMCKKIQEAKRPAKQELQQPDVRRETYFFEASPVAVIELPWAWLSREDDLMPPFRNEPPPTPPPRGPVCPLHFYAG